MAVRLIHNWWYVDIRHMGTRYRKRCPSNKQFDAIRYEQLLRSELAQHGTIDHMHFPRAHRIILLEELAKRWLREYVKVNCRPCVLEGNTSALYNRIIPIIGNIPITDIAVRHIDQLKAYHTEQGNSPKTINNYLAVLRRCLRSAVDWEILDRIPRIQLLKVTPPPFRFIEPDEARRLVVAAPAGHWRAMIVVALQTGLRASEIQGLEWQDIDFGRSLLQVRRGVVEGYVAAPKNNRMRFIPLTEAVATELSALPRLEARVFPAPPILGVYGLMQKTLKGIAKDAGITGKIGWHTLRHSFASHLVSAGAPLKVVQEVMGHSSYEMTLRYAHLSPNTIHQTMRLLPPLTANPQPMTI
jgi:integrase